MKIVLPTTYKNVSTNLPLSDFDLYDKEKSYFTGDKVSLNNGYNYVCTKDETIDKNPQEHTLEWISVPSNAFAWQYPKVDLDTSFSGVLEISFSANHVDTICLFGLSGVDKIQISINNAFRGTSKQEVVAREEFINDFYDYLFAPFSYKKEVFLYFYKVYYDCTIDIKIYSRTSKKAKVSYIHVGYSENIGHSLYKGTLRLRSFVGIERDYWGNTTIKQGNVFNEIDIPILISEKNINKIYTILTRAQNYVCAYVVDDSKKLYVLNVLGVFKDLEIPIEKTSSIYNLRIESILAFNKEIKK